jgi:glutathione peroxidase
MSFRRTMRRHDILEKERNSRMQQGTGEVYQFTAPLLDGRTVSLGEFRGKVLLIVNTASKCGFTPQYAGLEGLYRTEKERGFAVLGFPCNQFGQQEPGSSMEIATFCERNYGVSFPMFARIDVNGPDTHPLFRYLKQSRPGFLGSERIKWNFTKFLVGRRGNVVRRFGPATKPQDLGGPIARLLEVAA